MGEVPASTTRLRGRPAHQLVIEQSSDFYRFFAQNPCHTLPHAVEFPIRKLKKKGRIYLLYYLNVKDAEQLAVELVKTKVDDVSTRDQRRAQLLARLR